jgi:hypothetical protein
MNTKDAKDAKGTQTNRRGICARWPLVPLFSGESEKPLFISPIFVCFSFASFASFAVMLLTWNS